MSAGFFTATLSDDRPLRAHCDRLIAQMKRAGIKKFRIVLPLWCKGYWAHVYSDYPGACAYKQYLIRFDPNQS